MPAPGKQHNAGIINPFEEAPQRISEYTAQEIATLQSRLEKQLGPEYISSRAGPGGQKVHYVSAEKCIALANEVFGFNGWSSSIQNIQVDFVEEHPQTLKISLGLSVIVRVTLRDGTFHEDIGYGHIENCKGKAAAFEKAKKEGTTDALKRALRSFGNVLGNCIYDKSYLAKVTKMKVEPTKFDEGGLHRHQDFIKKEAADKEDAKKKAVAETQAAQALDTFDDILSEFDDVDFAAEEDVIHPDEVVLASTVQSSTSDEKTQNQSAVTAAPMQPPSRPMTRTGSGGSTFNRGPQTPNQQQNARSNQFNGAQNQGNQQGHHPPQQYNQNRPQQQHSNNNNNNSNSHPSNASNSSSTTTMSNGSSHQTPQQPQTTSAPGTGSGAPPAGGVGFFSARAVKEIPEDALSTGSTLAPQAGQVFNPRAESPSIRKTPGIDHTKSKPLARNGQHVAPPSTQEKAAAAGAGASAAPAFGTAAGAASRPVPQQQQRPGNVVNPQFDAARRIGAPGGPGSPLANRGQYRPPTIVNKRPLEGGAAGGRAPLADVSNNVGGGNGGVAMGISGPDVKRLKMG
ncbi:DNA repair and recombination protein rhm52 [Coniochaeta sp. 2T2.1]|nr:DNA repair and recombination protein rhm52 [Coniochaeta sp. 2T2.1]